MKKILTIIIISLSAALIYAQNNNEGRPVSELPAGYGDAGWGGRLSTVRENVKGRIIYTDEKTVIRSRDGEIEYHYGFFYIDPASLPDEELLNNIEDGTADTEFIDEGELFFVKLNFPFISRGDIQKKIENLYGPPVAEEIRNNRGALAWHSENTVLIMWIDTYEDETFCRRITYMSKEISQKLNIHQEKVFNRIELQVLERLEL